MRLAYSGLLSRLMFVPTPLRDQPSASVTPPLDIKSKFFKMSSRQPSVTRPLPEGRNLDGRSVWEPPIFAYDELIGEKYEKRHEAALNYTGGGVVRATKIMDVNRMGSIP